MNIEAQKRFLLRFCYAAVILAVTIFLCRYALPVLAPFVAALLVSLLLRPVVRLLHERCRVHKGVAAAVTVLLFYSLLGLALGLLSVKLFASAKAFVLNLPELYNTVVEPLLEAFSEELERFVARLDPAALSSVSGLLESAGTSIEQAVLSFSGRALTMLGGVAFSLPGWLLNTLIMIIATVFITADFPLLKAFLLQQLSDSQRERVHEVRVHLGKTLGRYVRSYALILFITFCELSVGLLLIGVEHAVLIALLIALFDILPVVGSGTVLIPWAIITAVLGNYRLAAGLMLLYIVVVIVRNVIEPKIVGQHVGLHPIVTLLSMVVGTFVFGPVGLLVLPVALAIAVSMNDAGVIHLFRRVEAPPDPPRGGAKRGRRAQPPGDDGGAAEDGGVAEDGGEAHASAVPADGNGPAEEA